MDAANIATSDEAARAGGGAVVRVTSRSWRSSGCGGGTRGQGTGDPREVRHVARRATTRCSTHCIDRPAALAFDPLLVKRLRRLRAARQRPVRRAGSASRSERDPPVGGHPRRAARLVVRRRRWVRRGRQATEPRNHPAAAHTPRTTATHPPSRRHAGPAAHGIARNADPIPQVVRRGLQQRRHPGPRRADVGQPGPGRLERRRGRRTGTATSRNHRLLPCRQKAPARQLAKFLHAHRWRPSVAPMRFDRLTVISVHG